MPAAEACTYTERGAACSCPTLIGFPMLSIHCDLPFAQRLDHVGTIAQNPLLMSQSFCPCDICRRESGSKKMRSSGLILGITVFSKFGAEQNALCDMRGLIKESQER